MLHPSAENGYDLPSLLHNLFLCKGEILMGSELYCPECRQCITRVISSVAFPDGVNADKRVLVVRVEPEQSAWREMEVLNSNPLEKIHVELDLTDYLSENVHNQKETKYVGRLTGYIHHCEGNRHLVAVTKGQIVVVAVNVDCIDISCPMT